MTSYKQAGVDQAGADSLVEIFKKLGAKTNPSVSIGGFGSVLPLDVVSISNPGIVVSTDGVGTKTELLARAGLHRTAGIDAVAMNVDDVVCVGARPFAVVDYVSVGRLDNDVVAEIVTGVSDACIEAGCSLVGGEVSQHPGLLPDDGYDVVVTCVGVVDTEKAWGPHLVKPEMGIVGIASSGPHANGFSLVRALLRNGEELPGEFLEPCAIYARRLLKVAESVEVCGAAHITGGGIAGKLRGPLGDLGARIDSNSWPRPSWCEWLASRGVDEVELSSTFNCGIGMAVITPDPAGFASAWGTGAYVIGEVSGPR